MISILPLVVDANPGPVPHPAVPNTDLPTLTIATPESPASLADNATVSVNVTVVPPASWAQNDNRWILPTIGSCGGYIYLDGVLKSRLMQPHDSILFTGYLNATLIISGNKAIPNNFTGTHTITIVVTLGTYSQIGTYSCNITQNVYFTLDADAQTVSFYLSPLSTIKGP